MLGIGSLINHGLPENVRLDSNEEDRTMDFFATRDIAAGDELVYDYGHDDAELATYYGIPTAWDEPERSPLTRREPPRSGGSPHFGRNCRHGIERV